MERKKQKFLSSAHVVNTIAKQSFHVVDSMTRNGTKKKNEQRTFKGGKTIVLSLFRWLYTVFLAREE